MSACKLESQGPFTGRMPVVEAGHLRLCRNTLIYFLPFIQEEPGALLAFGSGRAREHQQRRGYVFAGDGVLRSLTYEGRGTEGRADET